MSAPEEADHWFERNGIADLVRISDPDKDALPRSSDSKMRALLQLMHPRVWLPWFKTAILDGHGVGTAGPNWRQLTGVFLIRSGQIVAEVRHENSAARPDYVALARGASTGGHYEADRAAAPRAPRFKAATKTRRHEGRI